MKKSINVIVNGKPYAVEIEERGGGESNVVVNGVAYAVSIEAGSKAAEATVTPVPAAAVAPRETPRPAARPAAGGNGKTLTAPMPGVILDIAVKAGDKVAHGGPLCALEAMKMKNAIRAPREVVIASVEVQEGQKVSYGDVLFKFE